MGDQNDSISAQDQARLAASSLAEAESTEADALRGAVDLDEAGVPTNLSPESGGLPQDEGDALDAQLLGDAESTPPETDAGAIADEDG